LVHRPFASAKISSAGKLADHPDRRQLRALRFRAGAADRAINQFVIYPGRRRQNLDALGGLVDSQRVLLALTRPA
jgi:hypothetical protein